MLLRKLLRKSAPKSIEPREILDIDQTDTSLHERTFFLSDFDLLETLGTGTFGKVKLCKLKSTGEFFAMKILSKERIIKLHQVEHIKNEKNILYLAKECQFVTKILTHFQDEDYLYIVMEYIQGGELFSWSKYFRGMKESYVKIIVAELIVGFEYLHNKNVVYRDLKPENVLIDKTGHVKITDFGFAKQVEKGARTYTTCGTPECLAPEVILGLGQEKAVDFWALGILTYELIHGVTPFHAETTKEIYTNIIKATIPWPMKISKDLKDFIEGLLEKDPKARLGCSEHGIDEIKNNKWFKGLKWEKVYKRTIKTPFEIEVNDPGDTKYFSEYEEVKEEVGSLTIEEQALFKDF
jgi:serine/threonine protein kinase